MEVRLIVGDHAEHIEMAVVNLGKTDFFLGIDWLCYHNPSIDWDQSTLTFDRCLKQCSYTPSYESPDAEDEHIEERLEEGEYLFYMDWDSYLRENI